MTAVRLVGGLKHNQRFMLAAFGGDEVSDVRLIGAHGGGSQLHIRAGIEQRVTDVRLVGATAVASEFMAGALGDPKRMSDVRLVAGTNGAKGAARMSDVRLAALPTYTTQTESAIGRREKKPVSDVRLVVDANAAKNQVESGVGTAAASEYAHQPPSLLISYAYWPQFAKFRHRYVFRDFVLDSGAFTAAKSGRPVDLAEYARFALDCQQNDPACVEVFALDVIGDWRASRANTEKLWKAGVRAIPTYHYGEPEHVLLDLARTYPKIALGGAVGLHAKEKMRWVRECFARVWPKRIHGFGMMGRELLFAVPFHSVDASNWELAPAGFGSYKSMGKAYRAPRGKDVNLRAEVEWYLALERELKQRWAREMAKLATLPADRAHPKRKAVAR